MSSRLLTFLLAALLSFAGCHPTPRPASPLAERGGILAHVSNSEQRAIRAALEIRLRTLEHLVRRRADAVSRLARIAPAQLPLELPLDASTLAAPDVGRELSRRYLERVFALHGIVLAPGQAERVLGRCRWTVFLGEKDLQAEVAKAQRQRKPVLYRGRRIEDAFRTHSELLREDARRLDEFLTQLSQERYAEEAIESFYIAHVNALILTARGVIDLPVALPNLLRTLDGKAPIQGPSRWLGFCRKGGEAARQAGEKPSRWRALCNLEPLPYEGEYGQKYGKSLETGALLGLMTPEGGAVIEGALVETVGPALRWLSTRAGEGGAQLANILGWYLRKGGQAYALSAAVELGRGIQTLWRGGHEGVDGTFQPLGVEEAEALVEGILVDALVAKNVKGVAERQEGGWKRPSNWRLTKAGTWSGEPGNSRFKPENPAELGLKEGEAIEFRNGLPDFSPWSKGEFEVPGLNGEHRHDTPIIRKFIAERNGWLTKNRVPNASRAQQWLEDQRLSPHHAGGNRILLIPRDLHNGIRHTGGAYLLRNKTGE